MKRAFIFILSVLVASFSFAGTLKEERRVYYLDRSYSMVSPNKIWEKVCDNLMNAIDNVEDETTELIVVPFAVDGQHHSVLEAFTQKATSAGKEELKKKIRAIRPSTHSMTYHSDPIKDFYNNRVANDKITYMFLMTDGLNEEKPDLFLPELERWQSKYGQKDVYGFYVMLNPSARNPNVSNIINKTDHLWEVETADVNINLIRFVDNCKFNVRNDEYVDIPISGKIGNLTFTLSCNNNYYKIQNTQQENDYIRLYIQHPGYDEASLPKDEQLLVNITVAGAGNFDFLVTEQIKVQCCNKKVKGIRPTFNRGKKIEKLGKVTYHPSFWWSKEETQTLTDTLHLHFNADAKNENGFAEFQIVDNDGNPIPTEDLHIFIDGKEINDHIFKVSHNDEDVIITFHYAPSAKSGKHQGWLKLIRHNLDQDGNTELTSSQQNNSLHWEINYEKNMNPLAKGLLWIGVLILACLLFWFLVVKPIKYPRFGTFRKQVLLETDGHIVYQGKVDFKHSMKVVFTNKPIEQSFMERVFKGKILSFVRQEFTTPIVFTPNRNKRKANVHGAGYIVTPNPILQSGVSTITNSQLKMKLTLN